MRISVLLLLGLSVVSPAWADCSLNHTACDNVCAVKHLTDDAAEAGCKSRCVAERTACEAKQGAKAAAKATEGAVESVKSFINGLSDK
ncbi:hypothetical protein [Motiliproteus sediminis]|uniref:hypothetical protein n=1 Tax=Motiliproteus sediminis TaxID=1468178 RepID=UPI001AF0041E|nr:hypothetical protein [Motiliproteus sediminis]